MRIYIYFKRDKRLFCESFVMSNGYEYGVKTDANGRVRYEFLKGDENRDDYDYYESWTVKELISYMKRYDQDDFSYDGLPPLGVQTVDYMLQYVNKYDFVQYFLENHAELKISADTVKKNLNEILAAMEKIEKSTLKPVVVRLKKKCGSFKKGSFCPAWKYANDWADNYKLFLLVDKKRIPTACENVLFNEKIKIGKKSFSDALSDTMSKPF